MFQHCCGERFPRNGKCASLRSIITPRLYFGLAVHMALGMLWTPQIPTIGNPGHHPISPSASLSQSLPGCHALLLLLYEQDQKGDFRAVLFGRSGHINYQSQDDKHASTKTSFAYEPLGKPPRTPLYAFAQVLITVRHKELLSYCNNQPC